MKYEALYSAVLGAAPVVLIGYVLEIRFLTNLFGGPPPRRDRWLIHVTIFSTGLSGLLSLYTYTAADHWGENILYASVVTLGLALGIIGLTVFLWASFRFETKKR